MLLGTQRVNDAGHLEIGGCDTVDLARRFGTPLYVVDEAFARENCRRYRAAFAARYPGPSEVSYAGKAFLVTAMARLVDEEGLSLDVASGGELYTALRADFPPERILLHGNNKSDDELRLALEAGVGRIVVDNFFELRRLQNLAAEADRIQPILLRVTPGIDPHTHRRIRTGQEDTKFGLNIRDGSALEALTEAFGMDNVAVLGIHCHIGSQLLDTKAHTEAIEVMVGFLAEVREKTGETPGELNIGGGLGVRYLEGDHPPTYEAFADTICEALVTHLKRHDLAPPRLLQEPGRALIAEAGTTLYTIGPAKRCETDILITDLPLGDTDIGDILAVLTTGAYNHAMASNYNRLPRPTVVFVQNGVADVVYERETLDDLLKQDRIPARLAASA